jgi:Flp pilus assembly protein TadD
MLCKVSTTLLPPKETVPKAKEAASKALAVDETLAEPHAALGHLKIHHDWDWSGAERELKRAIELNPNYATAHSWYSVYLEATGRLNEAIAESKRAEDADPLSLPVSVVAARTFYYARRYDQAVEQFRKTLDMDPTFARAHWWLGMAYEQVGRREEAIAECRKALSLSGNEPAVLGALGHAYAASGKRAEAQRVLAELKKLSERRYAVAFEIALVYTGLGDKPQALQWLEKACEDRSSWLAWIKVDPQFDSLRGEPRFQDLVRRMGLG